MNKTTSRLSPVIHEAYKNAMLNLLRTYRSLDEVPHYLKQHCESETRDRGKTVIIRIKPPPSDQAAQAILSSLGINPQPKPPAPQTTAPISEPLQLTSQELMYAWFEKKGWLTKRGKTWGQWGENPDAMAEAVMYLVDVALKKDPRDIRVEDFTSNHLGGLLRAYYNNSPYAAISDAYPELDIKQWEMSFTPLNFYKDPNNRIAAIKWLVEEKLKKDPRDITAEDFHSNRLGGLLNCYYKDSPYAAISEAYPDLAIPSVEAYMRKPGRGRMPNGY